MDLEITKRQKAFICAPQTEVLFGGAAGGGKSYGQIIDALLKALQYPGIKQLILRRTFPELQKSLIRTALAIYPRDIAKYNESTKTWRFVNGSIIDFGYCDTENAVYQYQSAEYDIIRFDELTHFTEFMYVYLISRCRGANDYPKQIKSSTNPGGVGHSFVKARFIDHGTDEYKDDNGTRIFIPSKLDDNMFLLRSDPNYIHRLNQLPEKERKALRDGNWDIFEGMYFDEFDRAVHVIDPFIMPAEWRRYRVLDYGLDMLACYWIAVDPQNVWYFYKELYQSGLIVSDAAQRIKSMTNESVYATVAPPDLRNRQKDSGKSIMDLFRDNGVHLTIASNDRVQGWLNVKERLKIIYTLQEDGTPIRTAGVKIFANCLNLIRTLPQLQRDEKDPSDVANQPHELTHAPDAIRYFCSWMVRPNAEQKRQSNPIANLLNYGG